MWKLEQHKEKKVGWVGVRYGKDIGKINIVGDQEGWERGGNYEMNLTHSCCVYL